MSPRFGNLPQGYEIATEIKDMASRVESRFNPNLRMDNRYLDRSEKIDFAAKHNKCDWAGEAGNSWATPETESLAGKAALDKLQESGRSSIRFRDGEPEFSPFAVAQAKIDVTGDYAKDKAAACKAIAEQWNKERPKEDGTRYTAQDVKQWAKENNLELHHNSDMKTVMFIPAEIHKYFKHTGGVAEIKARNEIRSGSIYDE